MTFDNNQQVFFELVRAGLWPNDIQNQNESHALFKDVDWAEVYGLAEEQSVLGLVTAGIEANTNRTDGTNVNIPQEWNLQFIGSTLQIEQQNKDLNAFLSRLIDRLRKEDIYSVLVKGQGIAQCYEKPLWRSSGDVDLLLSSDNYERAKKVLIPLAIEVESEFKAFKHVGMTMQNGIVVELHGTMHSRLSRRVDKVIDGAQRDVFFGSNVRSWNNGGTAVFLPSPDNDVIFIFIHILKHFYIGGIGLRQICDWCRLLWTYRSKLDLRVLESRIRKMGLMSEWRAFGAFAVEYLGMPVEAMPFYDVRGKMEEGRWRKKAERIMESVLESGNFGHNRQMAKGKIRSAWFKAKDFARHTRIFPLDSVKFFFHFLMNGIQLEIEK